MNTVATPASTTSIGLLVRCYEGLRNWKALSLLAIGLVGGFALILLAGVLGQKVGAVVGALMMLLALVVYLTGINGAGLLLIDQADGHALRSIGAAFIGGLHSTWTAFLAFLLLGLGLCVVFAIVGIFSLFTRIPGVGSTFAFLFAGPGAVVLAFCYGVLVLGTPLMLVAVWRGAGVFGAIGRAVDIVVKRPLDALLHFVLLAILVTPVAAFVIGLLMATSSVSLLLFSHGSQSAYSLGAMSGGYGRYGSYGGLSQPVFGAALSTFESAGAASASIGVVMLVVLALFVLVGLFGYIMIHDSLGAGLEGHAADRMRNGMSKIKRTLDEHRPQPQPASAVLAKRQCSHCGASVLGDDRFCGECGQSI